MKRVLSQHRFPATFSAHVKRRISISITGRVQGVGFRPTVYRYATAAGLAGFVKNTPEGVVVEAEGASATVAEFVERLRQQPPVQARVDEFTTSDLPLVGEKAFRIAASQPSGDLLIGIPPDLAMCADCGHEIRDPANRRHGYPFTNCTCCGPRFTIVRALPYDRAQTALSIFPMCPACQAEYTDPADRRFDAQPNACAICGPAARLINTHGEPVPATDPLVAAADLLRQGHVLALKGLGGYHLCCDATQSEPIRRLRDRKQRPAKPFAVMFQSLEEVRRHCAVDEQEATELMSVAAPIVILRRRKESTLPPDIAPDTQDLGAFLPYTPLHHLLLDRLSPLVMTSGNRAEEPLAADEAELEHLLGTFADYALIHNRPIVRRCDDSVLKLAAGQRLLIRRARGFVPSAIPLPQRGPPVLAVGGDLKNVFALTRRQQAILSQHIGNLDEFASYCFLETAVDDLARLLGIQPEIVAHDLHPDYAATRFARAFAAPTHIAVQHHHAHIAAGMVEHGLRGPVIGVALDGLGYGPDGTIWGGEILLADYRTFHRVAHFKPCRMPGGDEATRHPLRMAWSQLVAEFGAEADAVAAEFLPALAAAERVALRQIVEHGVHSPWTTSAGRLFDAVAALLGFPQPISYEGQAAIRLQALAATAPLAPYPFALEKARDPWIISFGPTLRAIVGDLRAGRARHEIAGRFHRTIAAAITETCAGLRARHSLREVVLSGGVMQNDFLLGLLHEGLQSRGFRVHSHQLVPPNDGGLALGQAAVALAQFFE
jgi:hydrogenase maturation protein HypF